MMDIKMAYSFSEEKMIFKMGQYHKKEGGGMWIYTSFTSSSFKD